MSACRCGTATRRRELIRGEPWGRNMVLIALTGWGQEQDRKHSREAGFDHHLVKPVDPKVLMTLVADVFRGHRNGVTHRADAPAART